MLPVRCCAASKHYEVADCSTGAVLGSGSFYHFVFVPLLDQRGHVVPDKFVVCVHVRRPTNHTMIVLRGSAKEAKQRMQNARQPNRQAYPDDIVEV